MKIDILDNITGFGKKDWTTSWVLLWFVCGFIALFTGFWTTTAHTHLDWFYFVISIIGLVCVVSLSFRKNITGNGLGMVATAGEVIVQGTSGALVSCLHRYLIFLHMSMALNTGQTILVLMAI